MLKICAAICSLMGSIVIIYAASSGAGGAATSVRAPPWMSAKL